MATQTEPAADPKTWIKRYPDVPAADSREIIELRQLPLVGATRAQLFWLLGVRKLADIAALDETEFRSDPRVAAYPDGSIVDAFPLIQGYAKAITENRALVYGADPALESVEGPLVYFDLEFNAGVHEIFLWGLKRSGDVPVEQWFSHRREDQRADRERFITLVEEEDPLFVAYGSLASDEVAIREAARSHDLEGSWLRKMRFLDLLKRFIFTESPETQRVYLPVRKLKCEHVAVFFGYKKPRSIDVRDGYHALKLYQRYKRRPEPSIRDRLCRYNAEDLYQTELIFEGLKELFRQEE
ncbi:MAG: ribonuclease H-like domain-containing protein [Euryarchaeota archaeon]|nr:ribonuclease H-like domain-containing protein [Euryarchaeota archaeon]